MRPHKYMGVRGAMLYSLLFCFLSAGGVNTFSSFFFCSKANFIIKDNPEVHQITPSHFFLFEWMSCMNMTKIKSAWQIWMQLINEKLWGSSKAWKLLADVAKYFTVMDTCISRYIKTKSGKRVCAKIYSKGRRVLCSVCIISNETSNKRLDTRQMNSKTSFLLL